MRTDPVRRATALVVATVVLVAAAACTGDSKPKAKGSDGSDGGTGSAARSTPLRVQVTHVAGKLSAQERRALETGVGRTISAYVDQAFLAGDYPRSDFNDSFGAFTRGAVADARRDRALLTNQSLGRTTESVRAIRRTAYLSVLAPRHKIAGVTAAVDLVFVAYRGDSPPERIRLKGRLLLTRDQRGHWAIFGYDLNRADNPMRSTS